MTGVLEIVIELLLGYALASTAESVIHEYIADALPKIVAGWRRYPRLFGKLISTRYGHHVVHHHQTYLTTHVRQFETPCQRARVTDFLLRRGRYGRHSTHHRLGCARCLQSRLGRTLVEQPVRQLLRRSL